MTPEKAAVSIQRAFRGSKQRAPISRQCDDLMLREFLGEGLFAQASALNVVSNPAIPTKPFEIDPIKLQDWVDTHNENVRPIASLATKYIKHISFNKFLHRLQITIHAFNKKLAELPKSNQDYFVILGQAGEKGSNSWILSLALRFLLRAPFAIIPAHRKNRSETTNTILKERLKSNQNVKSILYLDDAYYSGTQVFETLAVVFSDQYEALRCGNEESELLTILKEQDVTLYLGAPYITAQQSTYHLLKTAGLRFSESNLIKPIKILPHIPMLSFFDSLLKKEEQALYNQHKAHIQYRFEEVNQKKGVTFFDHKIADQFSVPVWMREGYHLDQGVWDKNPVKFVTDGHTPY